MDNHEKRRKWLASLGYTASQIEDILFCEAQEDAENNE